MEVALISVLVLVVDQAAKLSARSFEAVRLGPFGRLASVPGRLWLARSLTSRRTALWLWPVAAAALVVGTAGMPSSHVFVGLLLGGSLSNLTEASVRGSVTDFVCLRFWPAFNLADVALVVGALGLAMELPRAVGAVG